MAVTDPTAVAFCNEKVRPLGDQFAQLYYRCVIVRDEWIARGAADFIPNDAGEVIDDGAALDGRPIITGVNVHEIAAQVAAFVAQIEANGNEALTELLAVSVNPIPRW